MKIKTIPSSWLEHNGRRLDCGPYMSGAVEAKMLIEKMEHDKLSNLTDGFDGGIFKAPRLSPNYVSDPEHGHPYLSSSDILCCDLTFVPLISKNQAIGLRNYFVKDGMTLVTSSGDTGRTAFARKDMDGMMGSPHFMRIRPNQDKIFSGYLFAFLSCKYGNRLMVSGTYGSIIQAIEPHHISELPVPRLGETENQAHHLIIQAANLRTQSNTDLCKAIRLLHLKASLPDINLNVESLFGVNVVSSSNLLSRLDGFFHSHIHVEAIAAIKVSKHGFIKVIDYSESIIEPARFKRIAIEQNEYAVPFFGTTPLMWATPRPNYFLSLNQKDILSYLVSNKTVLIPRSGQIAGLIGTAVLPYGDLIGGAITEDAIRINCKSEVDAGFLFVALRSEYGRRQLKARSYGSSIPHLDIHQIGQVLLPKVDPADAEEIGRQGLLIAKMRDEAIELEKRAIALVERTIEEGGR